VVIISGGARVEDKRKVRKHNGAVILCSNGNAAMHSVSAVDLHVTVKNIRILNVEQQCSYGEFMSLTTIKLK
jgi:hypothetical protein